MRITQNQFFRLAIDATQKHSRNILKAQEKIASGVKILRPSDDPTGTRRVMFLESNLQQIGELSANLDDARRFIDTAAEALTSVNNLIAEVRAAAIAGSNGTLSQTDRDTFAQQIDALREQLVGLANAEFQGQFLFAGTANRQSPFEFTGDAISYRGNGDSIESAVAPGLEVVMNVTGSEVFQSKTPLEPKFLGRTGVVPGSSSSNFRSEATLLLEHTATLIGDGAGAGGGDTVSGVTSGTSAASGNTILGSHSLKVDVGADGNGGTVSLNGGRTLTFSNTDTDIKVEGPDGEIVFLDMSGVTAGFSGTLDLDASGTYSLDGGTTTEAIDFADGDQGLTEPASGKTLYADSTNVRVAGSTQVLFQGGLDLFETLAVLRDDIFNESGLDSRELTDRVGAHVDELDRHLDTVLNKLTEIGSRSSSLENVRSFLDQQDLSLRDTLSSIQDTDVSQTIIELVRAQTLMDAASAISTQVLQNSLSSLLG